MKQPPEHPFSSDEAVEATAAAWLAEQDGGLSPEAAVEFARWRQADPRHEAAVSRLAAGWATLRRLEELPSLWMAHPGRPQLEPSSGALRRRFLPVTAAALAACLGLAAAWWWHRPAAPALDPGSADYATTAGGYQQATLPDGSVVELNGDTEVRVLYRPEVRRIQLLRGEAHFTVAKNKQRPFWVEARTVGVRAVGTAFDVCLRGDRVEVLVTEGQVQVDRNLPAKTEARDRPILAAGQRATVAFEQAAEPLRVEAVKPLMVQAALAWARPWLEFSDIPLAQVVTEFNLRNQVQLELGDPELGSLRIGGGFRPDNVEGFVRLLASGKGIIVLHPDANRIVLRKAR